LLETLLLQQNLNYKKSQSGTAKTAQVQTVPAADIMLKHTDSPKQRKQTKITSQIKQRMTKYKPAHQKTKSQRALASRINFDRLPSFFHKRTMTAQTIKLKATISTNTIRVVSVNKKPELRC
jgi:hypothetical protein